MSNILAWCSRRAGGIAMLGTIALSYLAISSELEAQRHDYKYQSTGSLSAPPAYNARTARAWVKLFAWYCLFIHFLVFVFPLRSCWAVFSITRSLRQSQRARALRDLKFGHRRRGSSTSLSSSETLTSSRDVSSTSSSEAGDLDIERYADGDIALDRVIHAIVIPNYKEEVETLRETLEVLASHSQARNTYDVSETLTLHIPLPPPPRLETSIGQNLSPRLLHVMHFALGVGGGNGWGIRSSGEPLSPIFAPNADSCIPGLPCDGGTGAKCGDQGYGLDQRVLQEIPLH
ncbi:hypothetical protein VTJ49DRAFT_6911 [Mycothermus thermophilus]|uniref:Uncharacterized protein n=1 Tax=Humicola insolens TaxID=85995 RepID=A0ABR3VJB9_HUMIN